MCSRSFRRRACRCWLYPSTISPTSRTLWLRLITVSRGTHCSAQADHLHSPTHPITKNILHTKSTHFSLCRDLFTFGPPIPTHPPLPYPPPPCWTGRTPCLCIFSPPLLHSLYAPRVLEIRSSLCRTLEPLSAVWQSCSPPPSTPYPRFRFVYSFLLARAGRRTTAADEDSDGVQIAASSSSKPKRTRRRKAGVHSQEAETQRN